MGEFYAVTAYREDIGAGVLTVEICECEALVGTLYYAQNEALGTTQNHVRKEDAIRTLLARHGFALRAVGPPYRLASPQD